MKRLKFLLIFIIATIISGNLFAQEKKKSILDKTKFSGKGYIVYDYDDDKELHNFSLKRGYFTVKSQLNNVFSFRYTQDIVLDKEGKDAGNIEIKVKYLYLKAKIGDIAFLTNTYAEIGLAHVPWILFEQYINPYRPEGLMFVDRNKAITSADFGVRFAGLIGGKMDEKYQKEVNKHQAGKYGSFAIGLFNGGGYHAIEKNSGKNFTSRLTIRPLPNVLPGIQLSHGFTYGQSNIGKNDSIDIPNSFAHVLMLSSESKYHKFTAQYLTGSGSYTGKTKYLDSNYKSLDSEGCSFFGQFLIPKSHFALFGRYDNFKLYNPTAKTTETFIGGVSYKFLKNLLIFAYEQKKSPSKTINYYKVALEVKF